MVNFGQLGKALDAAKSLAEKHGDKIESAIDKSAQAVDKATGGKHSDKIAEGGAKLKGAAGQLSGQDARSDPDTGAPPAPAKDAPVSDPGAGAPRSSPAADAPVEDPEAPKGAS